MQDRASVCDFRRSRGSAPVASRRLGPHPAGEVLASSAPWAVPIAWETRVHGDGTDRAIHAEISAQKGFLFWIVPVIDKAFLCELLSRWQLAGHTGRGVR